MAAEVGGNNEERLCITQHEQREYDACNWENPDFPGDHWMDDGATGPCRYAWFHITFSRGNILSDIGCNVQLVIYCNISNIDALSPEARR